MSGNGKPASEPASHSRSDSLRRLWSHREPVLWALLVILVVTMQWPTLKGWYYRAAGSEAPASSLEWRTDFDGALAEARSSGKLLLADFSAGWCPPCVAMKHEVWPDADVIRAIAAAYVPVVVDVDRNGPLSERYQVPGIPSVVVIDASGRVVRRHDGYLPKEGVLRLLAGRAD
jgi:thiol:disulfide interchange protein